MATTKQILTDIGVLLFAVAIGYGICYFTTSEVKQAPKQSTAVEHYIIQESTKKVDSLERLLTISNQTIDSLKQVKHEKVVAHKPLPKPVPTDSARHRNIQRFY